MTALVADPPSPASLYTSATSKAPVLPLGAPAVFDGLDAWPDISGALRERSTGMLKQNERDWRFAGGIVADDGLPTFGQPSHVATEMLTATIHEAGRFRYTDDAGIEWAVLIGSDKSSYWRGVAIGCTGSVSMLARGRRAELLRCVDANLETLAKPGRSLTSEAQRSRMQLTQLRNLLSRLDAAAEFLAYMSAGGGPSGQRQQVTIQFAAEAAWGPDQLRWPHPWRTAVFDAFTVLGSIQVQQVRFAKSGWAPEPLARQLASFGVSWVDTETVDVHLSPLFVTFIAEWLGPGKPAALYAARHGGNLRELPIGDPL